MKVSIIDKTLFKGVKPKNLVPKSQYKGPILKLTAKDKEKIEKLLNTRFNYEQELESIRRYLENNTKTISTGWNRLANRGYMLESYINDIDKEIRQIKIDRLNQQKK